MGSVTRVWVAAGVLAALAAVGAIALARGGGSSAGAAKRPQSPVSVRIALDREDVEFGDPVTAAVTVLATKRAVGSGDVKVRASLEPLTPLGPPKVSRNTRGNVVSVTYAFRGSCVDQRCLAARRSKVIPLAPAQVEVAGRRVRTPPWPTLHVRGRVSGADVAQPHPPLRRDTTPPPVTYRFDPDRLALVLEIVAAVLAAAGVLIAGAAAAALVRSRRRAEPLTGLERALALAREAERRPEADRRRALSLLARLLRKRDASLAGAADELAWSAPAPTPAAVSELVGRVEREANGT